VPLVRVPDVAQEQVAGQDAAPRARAAPVGRAAPEPLPAPAEQVLGGRAPVGPGPREQEPGCWEPERRARVVPVRSAAAEALAVSVSQGAPAVPIPAPADRDRSGEVPGPRGEEPPQGWVGSPVSVRLVAPTAGFGEPVFGGIVIGPEEGLGSLPGAMLAGVGSGFHAAVNLT